MNDYDAATYGDRIAPVYDAWARELGRAGAAEFLEELAEQGPALELGIGTGTLALALAERGVEVHGVEASQAMVEQLRSKHGGQAIPVLVADFSKQLPEGVFRLVYAVGDALLQLETQEEQIDCFRLVAARLEERGTFVVEATTRGGWAEERSRLNVQRVDTAEVVVYVSRHDPVKARTDAAHVLLSEQGVAVYPLKVRYAPPAELDLMARLAGLELRERWSNWRREPLSAESQRHVSVYGR